METNALLNNKLLFLLILFTSLLGCSTYPGARVDIPLGKKVDLNNSGIVKNKLYTQYKNWKGVEYRMGGLDKNGIDCSGFVYATFRSQLGVDVPRSTELQSSTGKMIDKNKLKTGDLVFFKTAAKVRHVGIYIENNNFLHASTSKGVMISKINDDYWKTKYWKAQRL